MLHLHIFRPQFKVLNLCFCVFHMVVTFLESLIVQELSSCVTLVKSCFKTIFSDTLESFFVVEILKVITKSSLTTTCRPVATNS